MNDIEDDPAPAEVTPQSTRLLAKLVLSELCEVAKRYIKQDPSLLQVIDLTLTAAKPPTPWLSRRTQPIPITKKVWDIGVLLDQGAEAMAIYIGTDGTPYCMYIDSKAGEQRVELTFELLEAQSVTTLANILTLCQSEPGQLDQPRSMSD